MGLTKTVYNPAALKAAQKTSEEALKKKQVRKMEEQATPILVLRTEGGA